eukprot:7386967-Prymnesium_polylepis.1
MYARSSGELPSLLMRATKSESGVSISRDDATDLRLACGTEARLITPSHPRLPRGGAVTSLRPRALRAPPPPPRLSGCHTWIKCSGTSRPVSLA